MATYYSPDGNPEVWEEKPNGYYTPEEWEALHPPPPPPEPTPAEIIQQYDDALEAYIDDTIRARGYTKREPSDYGKGNSDVIRYQQDAIDFKHFRDRVMLTGLAKLNEYQQTGIIPTLEEFLASLPRIAWTIDPECANPNEGMYINE